MGYVDEVLELVSKKNADQPEFLQAVTEVLNTLRPVVDANEELYRSNAILERITGMISSQVVYSLVLMSALLLKLIFCMAS